MDFVLIFGDSAVGKMTVGKALMEQTRLRLFHNHMMIEPVLEIFGEFHLPAIEKTRDVIFDEFLKTNQKGLIFTFMWAFSEPDDWDYVQTLHDKFTSQGATCYYVELVTDDGTRFERNKTELRLKEKASKRDIETTEKRMEEEKTRYRMVSHPGEVPYEHYLKIDNTHLSPDEVAGKICDYFRFK
ncbi:hypothetical protein HMI01_26230 [Halolactibacillus miurensis]|uniref:AAA domain-containing protein n=1 Tax=Halolactibacillus miurensis TaxID=306541 RepID=A0A1I6UWD1_9BACI|nr:AAA family ATPase [Halolactibacillus miurensis]GEM05635.1 hypothetical protein HMI01_26230 [Halolactibacillus miurensis]SFT05768.1 AAA domain-containing protein [Halolactibacillus miurensis]